MADVVEKTKSAYSYKYAPEDEILAKVTAGMDKYGLLLLPRIMPGTAKVSPYTYEKRKILKDGTQVSDIVNEILFTADMEYWWVNIDDPDQIIKIPWTMTAQQTDASFSFGGALTYSKRMFLLKTLDIATLDDDPEVYRSKKLAAENDEDREVKAALIETIGAYITDYLTANSDKRDDVITVIKKHVKVKGRVSGDYTKIESSKTASELLADLKETFGQAAATIVEKE